MKKMVMMGLLLLLTGCDPMTTSTSRCRIYDNTGEEITSKVANADIVTIEHDGEKHEYVNWGYGLAHWGGCRYCKENSDTN